ncbi:hypothetical protein [Pseudobacillus wudalianchiensis]|uniref:hypothetical protein n=1 Tax=Pseudobacillus wudalianchiensis TaxID=1743143 RepID=UPI001FE233FB|nr:hypothetical protein [Bacillus wudalianchiensis]
MGKCQTFSSRTRDWFDGCRIIQYLQKENEPIGGKIAAEYCRTLEKLELAAIAEKVIFS